MDTGLDSLKPASKKEVHKTNESLENRNADAVTNLNNDKIKKPVEEILAPPEKREEINELNK